MNEENLKFQETHSQTKLIIDDHVTKIGEETELVQELLLTNECLKAQMQAEQAQRDEVSIMVKQLKAQLAEVNKLKDYLRSQIQLQSKKMDRHKGEVDQKAMKLG